MGELKRGYVTKIGRTASGEVIPLERVLQCKHVVTSSGAPRYCQRAGGHGGYCKYHHPDTVAERVRKSPQALIARQGEKIISLQRENRRLQTELSRVQRKVFKLEDQLRKARGL